MKEDKFKPGDKVLFTKYFDRKSPEWDEIGYIPNYESLILNQEYTVGAYHSRNNSVRLLNDYANLPADSFQLVQEDKLQSVVNKLREDLLNRELTIKTNNEQRIMLRAICQELDINYYGFNLDVYVDINNSYTDLYTYWEVLDSNEPYLWYSTTSNDKIIINFEDLVEGFNQFKK